MLSQALPLKRTIFASELGARSDLASLRRRQVAIDDARPIAFKYPVLEGGGAIRHHYRLFTQSQIMTVSMAETINQDRSLRQDIFFTLNQQ